MATQINPALTRLWIAENARQYGYKHSLRLDNLSPAQHRVLDYLELGVTASQLRVLPELAKASEEVVQDLLIRLDPVLWQSTRKLPREEVESRFSEIARVLLLGGDPATTLATRKSISVFIEKLDSTGFTIAKAFSVAGIGKLISLDQKRIDQQDLNTLSYSPRQIGLPRVRAAKQLIKELEFHSRISGTFDQISAAIIIANDLVSPASYQLWLSRDIPHIAIVFDEHGVEISPLIIPGQTNCLGCLQLVRFESDPTWHTIAPQLLALDRNLADAAMMLFASGAVVNRLLNFFDFQEIDDSALRLNRDGEVGSFVPAGANCGCQDPLGTQKPLNMN
jgi:hypothetical protein